MKYKEKYEILAGGTLYIPKGIKVIPPYEFKRDQNIKKVVIEKDVMLLGREAFWGCKNLKQVLFVSESSCYHIGEKCFAMCLNLESVKLPNSLVRLGSMAFQYDLSLKEVNFFYKIRYIGSRAFENCAGLKRVAFLNPMVNFDSYVFFGCYDMRTIQIGDKNIETKFLHYNVVALGSKFYFQGGEACLFTMCNSCRDGKILGEKFFYFFLDNGEFIGVGENLHKAYEEAIFLKTNHVRQQAIEEEWTLDTKIGMDEYRAISGDCLIGVESFLKNYHVNFDEKKSIREIIFFVQGAGRFDVFKNFVDSVIIPNTEKKKQENTTNN